MITLTACASYGLSGQYVAQITGRDPKYQFARSFIGRKGGKRNEDTSADVDEAGLYEVCDATKRDKEDALKIAKELESGRDFADVVSIVARDPEAVALRDELKELKASLVLETAGSPAWTEAMAKTQACQVAVGSIPRLTHTPNEVLQPALRIEISRCEARLAELAAEGKMPTTTFGIVSARDAKNRKAAATSGCAVEQVMAILAALPAKQAAQVLKEVKARLTPAPVAPDTVAVS